jgi:hypothetical protein
MGSGSGHTAQTTRPAQDKIGCSASMGDSRSCLSDSRRAVGSFCVRVGWLASRAAAAEPVLRTWIMRAIKLDRAISTGKLNASPRLHTQPINVVVFHGSQGSTRFEVGFPLRCLQRLSRPYVATLHCGWRHNSSTRGTFIPVLSY